MTIPPGLPELRDWQLNKRHRYYAGRVYNHPKVKAGQFISGQYVSAELQKDWSYLITNKAGDQFILLKADMTIYKED